MFSYFKMFHANNLSLQWKQHIFKWNNFKINLNFYLPEWKYFADFKYFMFYLNLYLAHPIKQTIWTQAFNYR